MRKRIFKGIAAVLLMTTITASTVFADDVDKLKQQKEEEQKKLNNLEDDWAYLLTQMDELELKMASKSDEISDANAKLEEAEKIQQSQYEDMKLRINVFYGGGLITTEEYNLLISLLP